MRLKNGLSSATLVLILGAAGGWAQAPPVPGTPGAPPRRPGGFVPGQKRAANDPAEIDRGKRLYGISCTGCHGADLRGGDLGGPNLLRSQVALSDQNGELIVPIIQGSRQAAGMPAIPMSPEDAKAVAAYVRTVLGTIGGQGMPPAAGREPPSILVGDATAGQKYFAAKCVSCHSETGDLKGIAGRIADPKTLQNAFIAGGARPGRRGPVGGDTRAPTVTVTAPSGEKVEGRLARIDDFIVSVTLADGTLRTFRRDGDVPKVEIHDPMQGHKDLLKVYTDKDIHNLTAYLVTLK